MKGIELKTDLISYDKTCKKCGDFQSVDIDGKSISGDVSQNEFINYDNFLWEPCEKCGCNIYSVEFQVELILNNKMLD